ncbi:hypothetical protein P4678_24830 [Priestia megaterium]|uniref:hypothetical protein n=1 Tax=Priestia megaterium TaxID=1404 RepID=UPI002E211F10|nr:hypothetical protein [Priestia megaterium]MED4297855.1 hypothetical protein [Priestia megaterium]
MDIIVRNINTMAMREIDEIAKEKKISPQEFLKGRLEKSLATEKRNMTRGKEKRKNNMNSRNFLHVTMEHNLQKKRNATQEMKQ